MAHFLLELWARLKLVGMGDMAGYECPLTQYHLADALGLSAVHVNRVLRQLRGSGLIRLKSKNLVILDVERLKALSGFNPNYLHLADRNGLPERSL